MTNSHPPCPAGFSAGRAVAFALMLILIGTGLAGCIDFKSAPRKIRYYSLEYDPPTAQTRRPLSAVLRVERFQVSPYYDTNKMVYRDAAFLRDAYLFHKWWARPGDIVSHFLARDFEESNRFKGVFALDRSMPATHVLEGTVEEFCEYDKIDSAYARLKVSLTLMAADEPDVSRRIYMQRQYRSEQPMADRTPLALAEAMSRAMADISRRIITDVHQRIALGFEGD